MPRIYLLTQKGLPWDYQKSYQSDSIKIVISWWRHQLETFSALLALCAGNSPVSGEFPSQRPVTRSFDVFFDLRLNKRLSKQSWDWWFETPSWPLWRHRNVRSCLLVKYVCRQMYLFLDNHVFLFLVVFINAPFCYQYRLYMHVYMYIMILPI